MSPLAAAVAEVCRDPVMYKIALPRAAARRRWAPSALGHHVPGVLFCGPQEQVSRVHAGRVVAAVAYPHAARGRAVGQFPGEAMSADGLVSAARPNPKLAIPSAAFPACPRPAGVDRFAPRDEFPEALGRRHDQEFYQ